MTSVPERAEAVRLPIRGDGDLTAVRHQVRALARELGFGLVQQTKIVTAASELARNTLLHGGGGEVEVVRLEGPSGPGLRVSFTDSGPGIPDVERALQDGFSTANGLGMGLGGAKRLVQEFGIEQAPGGGARVTIASWAVSRPAGFGA
ncbi:serine/threonine-protein kinase RsbT [Nocardiopsis flavescens]|uniref:Serine/threonine-protein kinase RsbT n=1 Tax=Nocardiopsis flavescens TaxID=758803 RepID=A0A1M6FR76_9ACTN|nr:anti-sigma regulatory factor [Nocardiopsis flavescens]SHJ00197.1 serine/threonine-protein kinase RsbT [Nocardiopsis flavescens]